MASTETTNPEAQRTGDGLATFEPTAGRNPGTEVRAAEAVARTLWQAVRAFAPDAVADTFVVALETLEQTLQQHLEVEHFLWLHITSSGFRVRNRFLLSGESRALAARLAADGVIELLFKEGVTRRELERCIEALRPNAPSGADSAATRLWEAGLRHVVFRCRDEILGAEDPRLDLRTWSDTWPAGSAAAEHDALVRRFEAAAHDVDTITTNEDWRERVALTAEDRARLKGFWLDEPQTVTERLARRLASLHDEEREAVRGGESLVLLGDVVEALLLQRKFQVLRDVIAALQGRDGEGAVSDATLDQVTQRICSERNVQILGAVLDGRQARTDDIVAVRDILAALPGAVDPLCRLLVRLEDMTARRLACRVLALVAKEDPHALAQRAAGQPWYLARNVAYVLGRIGGGRVLPFLKRWIAHEDERVRVEVARSLGRVHDPGAGNLLTDMLEDPSWRVRQSAVWSLAELGDPHVLPRLRAVLFDDRTFRARRSEERDDFFRTYGRLADAAAFKELARLFEQRQFVAVGWQAELRRGAALALGETGLPDARRVLRAHQNTRDARLRQAVMEALDTQRHGSAATLADEDDWSVPARIAARPSAEVPFRLEFAEEK